MSSQNIFETIKMPGVSSNTFNLSHDVKMSFSMGGLYPTCVMECVPGDKFKIGTETMLRFAPLISPVMHKVRTTTHYFFVLNRILWDGWEKWITGEVDQVHPYINLDNVEEKSVMDYLGFPIGQFNDPNLKANPFPIAAYYKIYNEYYRDQNLIEPWLDKLVEGPNEELQINGGIDQSILKRAWMHDYFTSCLPFAQKGDSVQIPLGNVDINFVQGFQTIARSTVTNNPILNS